MEENILKFISIFTKAQTEGGPHEAAFGILKDLARNDSEIIEWVESQFTTESDSNSKSDLARIAISTRLRGEFEQYLRDHDDWEDSDFEDI